jgi:6-phosphogluconolactonase
MELVGAPVTELKALITQSFEDLAGERANDAMLSCALSGGAAALIYLGALKDAQVDWRRITLFWADERAVAPDDPESNFGIAERMLLKPLGAHGPTAIRMPTDQMPLGHAARWYDESLANTLNNRPLDLAILGVGEDGHVGSLFPGHPSLSQKDLRAVAIEDAPRPPQRRLSLTLRFLLQTRKIWLIAIGQRKLPALQAAIARTSSATPLDVLVRQAAEVTVFTDQSLRASGRRP